MKEDAKQKNSLRRKVNKLCVERTRDGDVIVSFGETEELKGLFNLFLPFLFTKDTVNKWFFLNKISKLVHEREGEEKIFSNTTMQGCFANICSISKRVEKKGLKIPPEAKILTDDVQDGLIRHAFAKQFLFDTQFTPRIRESIRAGFHEISSIRDPKDNDLNVYSETLKKLVIDIYRIILLLEKSISNDLTDNNVNSLEIVLGQFESASEISAYKDAVEGLVGFKKDLYPFILRYIGECHYSYGDENKSDRSKDKKILELLEIDQGKFKEQMANLRYETFREKEKARMLLRLQVSLNSNGNSKNYEEQAAKILRGFYPELGIGNMLRFEFSLPRVYVALVSSKDRKEMTIDAREFSCISKDDPVQIVISLYLIIYYDFLVLLLIENKDISGKFGDIVKSWSNYFSILKSYLKVLVEYDDETDQIRKIQLENKLQEIREEIFFVGQTKMRSCYKLVESLVDLLRLMSEENVKISVVSKYNSMEMLKEEAIPGIFMSYDTIVNALHSFLTDGTGFLVKKIGKVKASTDLEAAILSQCKLLS